MTKFQDFDEKSKRVFVYTKFNEVERREGRTLIFTGGSRVSGAQSPLILNTKPKWKTRPRGLVNNCRLRPRFTVRQYNEDTRIT